MPRRLGLVLLLLIFSACEGGTPSVEAWLEDVWRPLVAMVPEPGEQSPAACDEVLGHLREVGADVRPAPVSELGDAADSWVRQAETLMFDCAADAPGFDYGEGHRHLSRLEDEVQALTSP
jgi:hypothetical protein